MAVFVYILSSKGASQLQVLYKGIALLSKEIFQLKLQSSNIFPAVLILEIAELLGQNLKSLLWKIMSWITLRFCKLSSLVVCVCVCVYVLCLI